LDEQDMIDVYQKAFKIHISEVIADSLEEGLIEITGLDPNGELIYGLTEAGQKELEPQDNMISAKFERIESFGPFCLN
jgi:DNA-binding PadR family transcriptional regulator